MHSFTTDRLLIRPLATQDKTLFINLYTNTKIMRYIATPLDTKSAEKSFYNTLKLMDKMKPKIMVWAIINVSNGEVIGIQGFTWPKKKQHPPIIKMNDRADVKEVKQAELGIIITTQSQGMGFAQESITALINYGFNYISLERINAFYATENLASKQLFDKLNFIYDVTIKSNHIKNGFQYIDRRHWLAPVYLTPSLNIKNH